MKSTKARSLVIAAVVGIMTIGSALAAKSAPVVYPGAPEQPRIQFLKTINGSGMFAPANPYGNRFPGFQAQTPAETDPLMKPYGIALANGKIYVCDQVKGAVSVFDLEKKVQTFIGLNDGAGKLTQPLNIAVAQDGTKYVADPSLGKVMVYDANDSFVRSFGDTNFKPSDVILANGHLYVVELNNSVIQILDPKTGDKVSQFGGPGAADDKLFKATNIAVDQAGNIYVSDTINARVKKFSADGKWIRNFGEPGDQLGQFSRPKGIAVDREGRVYATDAAFENVQIFDKDGKLLLPFGGAGNVPGGINMPAKVAIDYNHVKYFADNVIEGYKVQYLILVSSQFGDNKVNVYGFLEKK